MVRKSGTVKVKCTNSGKNLSWQKIIGAGFTHWTTQGPTGHWSSVALSSDGMKLIAVGMTGRIYISHM